MGTGARTFLAFVLSALAGCGVVQALSFWTQAQGESLALFVLPVFVAVVTTILFLLARLAGNPDYVVAIIAKTLLALIVLGFAGLTLTMLVNGGPETVRSELGILVALFLPSAVVVLIQWRMFGPRKSEKTMRFGRGAA